MKYLNNALNKINSIATYNLYIIPLLFSITLVILLPTANAGRGMCNSLWFEKNNKIHNAFSIKEMESFFKKNPEISKTLSNATTEWATTYLKAMSLIEAGNAAHTELNETQSKLSYYEALSRQTRAKMKNYEQTIESIKKGIKEKQIQLREVHDAQKQANQTFFEAREIYESTRENFAKIFKERNTETFVDFLLIDIFQNITFTNIKSLKSTSRLSKRPRL